MPHKILVIDDDPYIVKYLVDILSDNGYATCSASDGAEGLELLKREKPDLVTLDLEMPNEWGPRVSCIISSNWLGSKGFFNEATALRMARWIPGSPLMTIT